MGVLIIESRRAARTGLDPAARQALDWFRAEVPEHTLYNWQTAAAKLVTRDLSARVMARGTGIEGDTAPSSAKRRREQALP